MKKRRQFIKLMLGLFAGAGLLFNPLARAVQVAFAKVKKIILPKGTRMDTLTGKNPASLDTRNLELTPVAGFDTMGLADHDVDLNKWQLEIGGHVQRSLKLTYHQILQIRRSTQ